ncbi:MAG: HD domain-containing phosphohydrolase [Candidatus Xenobiia bacterium LiM19]
MEPEQQNSTKKLSILIAEDSRTQALKLQLFLESEGFQVTHAIDGKKALEYLGNVKPDMVISDVMMPDMTGLELCSIIKSRDELKEIPVILLTTLTDPQDVMKGLESGADSYAIKPFDPDILRTRIAQFISSKKSAIVHTDGESSEVAFLGQSYKISGGRSQILNFFLSSYDTVIQKNRELETARDDLRTLNEELEIKVQERTAELMEEIQERKLAQEAARTHYETSMRTFQQTIRALGSAVEKRDPYTAGHQYRVAELACAIAGAMDLPVDRIEGIHMAAIIHDLGKIYIPSELLNKPGELTNLEFSIIKTHTEVGYDIIKSVEFPWPVADTVLHHHEKLDGSGYPHGLKGDQISLEARILSVADVIEAMSSHRPYRAGLGIEIALDEISRNRGIQFDPVVVDACVDLFLNREFKFSRD